MYVHLVHTRARFIRVRQDTMPEPLTAGSRCWCEVYPPSRAHCVYPQPGSAHCGCTLRRVRTVRFMLGMDVDVPASCWVWM